MENASKALFIAAGVIISLMVLSLGVYLFVTFGQAAKDTHGQVEEAQLNQFNSQFTMYQSKENLTIYDVITVANLATRNNINNELSKSDRGKESSYYIAVYLDDRNLKTVTGKRDWIEEGYGVDVDSLDYQNIIKTHVDAMMAGEKEIDQHRYMPEVKCNDIKMSSITRKSI